MSSCRLYRVLAKSITLSCPREDRAGRASRATKAGRWVGPLLVGRGNVLMIQGVELSFVAHARHPRSKASWTESWAVYPQVFLVSRTGFFATWRGSDPSTYLRGGA